MQSAHHFNTKISLLIQHFRGPVSAAEDFREIRFECRDVILLQAACGNNLLAAGERFFVAAGGLASYGPDIIDQFRRSAAYIDRILKGEKPADLPVQAPIKYEMAINLRTAKALGLTVPPSLIATADEVIE